VKERLAQLLALPEVSHRRMMGADCFLVGGHMFAILPADDTVAMKLPDDERERFLALSGAGPFVVSRGAFGKWLQAPLAALDDGSLLAFAQAAREHVRANPPAKPRKRRFPRA